MEMEPLERFQVTSGFKQYEESREKSPGKGPGTSLCKAGGAECMVGYDELITLTKRGIWCWKVMTDWWDQSRLVSVSPSQVVGLHPSGSGSEDLRRLGARGVLIKLFLASFQILKQIKLPLFRQQKLAKGPWKASPGLSPRAPKH